MKRLISAVGLVLASTLAIAALAQESAAPTPTPLPLAPFPDAGGLLVLLPAILTAAITIATPFLQALLKALFARMPKVIVPYLSPIVGLVLGALAEAFGITGVSTETAMAAGAAGGIGGNWLRETVDQTKKALAARSAGLEMPRVSSSTPPPSS